MNLLDEQRRLNRIFIFAIIAMASLLILLGRLFYMQVVQGDKYRNLAHKNSVQVRFSAPTRGVILGRGGDVLASNRPDYRLFLIPRHVKDIDYTLKVLFDELHVDLASIGGGACMSRRMTTVEQTYQRLGKRSMTPILVRKHLDLPQILKLEMAGVEALGGEILQSATRVYPLKEAAAHVLGYMGAPLGEQEVLLSKLGRMSVGKTGLEGQYEALLFGKPGTQEIEVNAAGQLIRILEKKPFESGETLKTTIYGELQTFVYNLLSAHKSGSAVVMNAQTGEVLAMVSYPSFDPHVFEDGILENEWRALLNDPYRPLTNKATSGLYAPGSVFKMIVALAALDAGIDPLKTHSCVGGVLVGNHMFHCHKPGGHGQMDLKSAITESCDVYFYEVAQKVGIEKIAQMALKFGLGAKTALDFPSEKEGLIPGKEWKQRVKKDSWKVYDTILSSIGQGYILSSPLQLAQLTARLATGKAITPRLTGENPIFESLDVLPVHLKIIQESMENVVNHPFGTGYASRLESVKYSGKTATSQVKRISMRERALNLHQSRSWGDKDHAIFTGYGPSESPKYVVAVVIEHGGSGSRIAAPIAGAIFKWLLEK